MNRIFRLHLDYRRLNKYTRKNKYSFLLRVNLKKKLQRLKRYTKLDLKDAFNLIYIKHGEKYKIAFRIKYRLFEN